MTNADLIWRLVELLIQKEKKDINQVALDQAKTDQTKTDQTPNSQKPDEV